MPAGTRGRAAPGTSPGTARALPAGSSGGRSPSHSQRRELPSRHRRPAGTRRRTHRRTRACRARIRAGWFGTGRTCLLRRAAARNPLARPGPGSACWVSRSCEGCGPRARRARSGALHDVSDDLVGVCDDGDRSAALPEQAGALDGAAASRRVTVSRSSGALASSLAIQPAADRWTTGAAPTSAGSRSPPSCCGSRSAMCRRQEGLAAPSRRRRAPRSAGPTASPPCPLRQPKVCLSVERGRSRR